MNRQERALEVAKCILEAQNTLAKLEKEFAELFSEDYLLKTKGTMPERILAFMRADPTKSFDLLTITNGIGADIPIVRSAVARLANDGKLQRIRRGSYKISERVLPL